MPDAGESLAWAAEKCAARFPKRIHDETLLDSVMTAYRLKSLLSKNGDDDYFSVDLPDEERKERFSGICVPTFVLWNGDDEYVPDKSVYCKLTESYKRATDKIEILPIAKGGKHSSLKVGDLKTIINKYINIYCEDEYYVSEDGDDDEEGEEDEDDDEESKE